MLIFQHESRRDEPPLQLLHIKNRYKMAFHGVYREGNSYNILILFSTIYIMQAFQQYENAADWDSPSEFYKVIRGHFSL
jgi:hypothetical protein